MNVCGMHFHDRKHRYREPAIQPVPLTSMPNTLVDNAKQCIHRHCTNTPIKNRDYCPMHVVVGLTMASV